MKKQLNENVLTKIRTLLLCNHSQDIFSPVATGVSNQAPTIRSVFTNGSERMGHSDSSPSSSMEMQSDTSI